MKGQRGDMNLRAVEQERAWIEAAENDEGLRKAVFLLLRSTQPITSTEEEGNRNKGNDEAFFPEQLAIAVSAGRRVFQTSRYQAPNKDLFW